MEGMVMRQVWLVVAQKFPQFQFTDGSKAQVSGALRELGFAPDDIDEAMGLLNKTMYWVHGHSTFHGHCLMGSVLSGITIYRIPAGAFATGVGMVMESWSFE
jgi:hypothetical protein